MKNIFKLAAVFLLIVWTFLIARADGLDDFVRAEIKKRQIPGLSIVVIRDGKIVRANGYGLANVELNVPATKDTVYEIGSISKQFAAEAVMLLVEDGKLRLDDPVNKYLPANAPAAWQKITVRNLLNHTVGLQDWTAVKEFSYRREYTAEEFIDLVKGFPLGFEPGENWSYSNTNFPLLGIIVERASGRSYEDFVGERIFKPLGLTSFRFRRQDEITANRASGYVLKGGAIRNGEPFRPRIIAPSGGVLASAVDLARWWEMVLNARVVKQASLEQMLAPAILNSGRRVTHGFAFFTDTFNSHKMIFHHGSTVGGFGSVVRYFPREKLTIAVTGNLEDGGFGPEYISKRVADFYIPGAYLGGLKEGTDAKTEALLQLLRDIAANKPTEMLTTSFAGRINTNFRETLAKNLAALKTFSFLAKEKIGADHFILDPTLTDVYYYKLTTADRTVYYHFRLDKDGKVGFIVTEE